MYQETQYMKGFELEKLQEKLLQLVFILINKWNNQIDDFIILFNSHRHLWDEDLLKWRVVERLGNQCDVMHYIFNTMAPHPNREYCVLRYVVMSAIT